MFKIDESGGIHTKERVNQWSFYASSCNYEVLTDGRISMRNLILFIHVISAVLLGGYIIFPYLVERAANLSDDAQRGFAALLSTFNRIGHYALIAVFVTGMGLISHIGHRPSFLWIGTVVVFLVVLGGAMGILSKGLKQLIHAVDAGEGKEQCIRKIRVGGWIASLAVIVEVFIMTNPQLLSLN
jgi:hypothetical protein